LSGAVFLRGADGFFAGAGFSAAGADAFFAGADAFSFAGSEAETLT
jgi:hypothetical protein